MVAVAAFRRRGEIQEPHDEGLTPYYRQPGERIVRNPIELEVEIKMNEIERGSEWKARSMKTKRK